MTIPFADPKQLEAYCMPFIKGQKKPETAAQLMAARYVAYTLGEAEYIIGSHDPGTRDEIDRDEVMKWSKGATWQGLEIISTDKGEPTDDAGEVEFIAHYAMDGRDVKHHERSTFERIDGQWYFMDAKQIQAPVRREGPKIGRNDPCSCGSGKKYKKCHGK